MFRMDRHSQFGVLPSYTRYSKREILHDNNKTDDAKDTTFANIRKRLNSTILTVPYDHKLDNFNSRSKKTSHSNLVNGSKKIYKDSEDGLIDVRKPRSRVNSENESSLHDDTYSFRIARAQGSSQMPEKSSYPLPTKLPRVRKERAPSETSTCSTRSRPLSFSKYELDDSFWKNNSREIEEIKERYAENSEFVASIHGFLEETSRKAKKKNGSVHPEPKCRQSPSRSRDSSLNSKDLNEHYAVKNEMKGDKGQVQKGQVHISKSSPRRPENKYPPPRHAGRLILPSITKHDDDTESVASTWTTASGSSSSTLKNSTDVNVAKKFKRRKVEFNLLPKIPKGFSLPTLNSNHVENGHYRPPRSILKKQEGLDNNNYVGINQMLDIVLNDESKSNSKERDTGGWERHLPRLLSPIPASATRRNPIVFKNASNSHFKCSQEFRAVMGDFEDE